MLMFCLGAADVVAVDVGAGSRSNVFRYLTATGISRHLQDNYHAC